MEKSNLTQAVEDFKRTGENEKEIIEEIACQIYFSPLLKKYLTREQRNDFLSSFYTGIPFLIRNYQYSGKPFEAYLHFIAKKRVLSYLKKEKEKNEITSIIEDAHFSQEVYHPVFPDDKIAAEETLVNNIKKVGKISNKRILFLFLREFSVSEPQKLSAAARLTGYDEEWIQQCADKLRFLVYQRIKRAEELKKYRNRTYFSLFMTERRLSDAVYESERKPLRDKITKLKKKLITINTALTRTHPYPTHKEIALVTGDPKGSVDSGLYYIKQTFLMAAENEKLSA